jgi:hypothetical protein
MMPGKGGRPAFASQRSPSWQKLLETPYARMHFVQLFESQESALPTNVGLYVSEGLRRGDAIVVVCTEQHRAWFSEHIHETPVNGQLIWLDAHETLDRFMRGAQPDWAAFERAMTGAWARVAAPNPEGRILVYGEMVGILWNAGLHMAAVRLEQFWNRLLEDSSFSLYCSYSMDMFDVRVHNPLLEKVLCAHSHLIPADATGGLKKSLWRAMEDVLGDKSHEIRNLNMTNRHASWVVIPEAEAMMMCLTRHVPQQLSAIVERAREHFHNQSAKRSTFKSPVLSQL